MTEHTFTKMADDVFGAIRRYVARNLAPVADRVDALERRAPEKGERGEKGEKGDKGDPGERGDRGADGRDAAVDLEALALKAAALIPPPAKGKDAELVDIDAIALTAAELVPAPEIDVDAIAKQAAALVPTPRDGRDAPEVDLDLVAQKAAALLPAPKDGKDAPAVDLDEVAQKAAALIPAPRDGRDADSALIPQEVERQLALLPRPVEPPPVDAIVAQVLEQVMKAFDALPAPKDGKDADAEAIAADVLARVMKELPTPKDGRDGVDGKDGRNGNDAPPVDLDALAVKVLDKAPRPEDGRDGMEGPPGRDALHLEIQPEIDPERSYRRGTFAKHAGGLWRAFESTAGMKGWECVVQGLQGVEARQDDADPRKFVLGMTLSDGQELVKDFRFAFPLDRGVFDPESHYVKGDGVTYMGGWFVAQRDDPGRPEVGDGWRLAVKRGRNGKDGKDGERGEVGKAGPPGRDLTQMLPDGTRF